MFNKFIYIVAAVLLLGLIYGCSQAQQSTSQLSIESAINSNLNLFNVGDSDAASDGTLSLTSPEARPYSWYRIFNTPSNPIITLISNNGASAVVEVDRDVNGVLYIRQRPSSNLITKSFSQTYKRFVGLVSTNEGVTWTINKISNGLSKSTVGVNSMDSDITISRIVVSVTSEDATTTTVYDVSSEASVNGPWNTNFPIVFAGSTINVTVYASRDGDSKTPFAIVWPGISTIFRRALFDNGTHGDLIAGDGTFVNTAEPFVVPTNETQGIRHLHIGVFSAATLADAASPYDFTGWHFIYRIQK